MDHWCNKGCTPEIYAEVACWFVTGPVKYCHMPHSTVLVRMQQARVDKDRLQ